MAKAKLTEGPIGKTLIRMTIPMILGIVSMMLFNLIDTYWVARLGQDSLTAISFTFPAAYSSITLAIGLGVGVSAVIAKAIGEGDEDRSHRLIAQALALGVILAVVLGLIGIATHDLLFRKMGAELHLIPLIREYMILWYAGLPILMLPIICNGALRATGDARTPGMVMGSAALLNLILDPVLIFGYFGAPAMGIRGAAVATLISWGFSLVLAYRALTKEGYLDRWRTIGNDFIQSSAKILSIGLPAAFTNMLTPLSAGVITAMAARFGSEEVAGFGVASRVEPIAMVVVIALSTALGPFVGQNWGAGNHDRVRSAVRSSLGFAALFGMALIPVLMIIAQPVAEAFSESGRTIVTVVDFLWVIPFSFPFIGITLLASAVLNAMHRPLEATALNLLRLFLFLIPLALLGGYFAGIFGMFAGVAVANLLSGLCSLWRVSRAIQ